MSEQRQAPVVVITGSTRGLGLALAQAFLERGCQVLVSGRGTEAVREALGQLGPHGGRLGGQACDVTDPAQVGALWDGAVRRCGRVDIWINNAGVGQDYLRAWELPTEEVIRMVETNVLGVMHGSRVAMRGMRAQGGGAIYNMEGWGSDGKRRSGLTVYGTTKRAVRYFTRTLADEAAIDSKARADAEGGPAPGSGAPAQEPAAPGSDGDVVESTPDGDAGAAAAAPAGVLVGTLSPGMMVTDFLLGPMERMADADRMRRVVNILGDRPETVAAFLADKILSNRRNRAHFAWLTGAKVIGRFLRAALRRGALRRDLFASGPGRAAG